MWEASWLVFQRKAQGACPEAGAGHRGWSSELPEGAPSPPLPVLSQPRSSCPPGEA